MKQNIRIKVYGIGQVEKMTLALKDFIRSPRMLKTLVSASTTAEALARKTVPKQTYLLRKSIFSNIIDFMTNNPKIVLGTQGSKYAKWVEEGSVRHDIVPRNKKWLRWTTQGYRGKKIPTPPGVEGPPGLVEIFKKKVSHPGSKAQPFIRPSLEKVRPKLLEAIAKAISAHLQETKTKFPDTKEDK